MSNDKSDMPDVIYAYEDQPRMEWTKADWKMGSHPQTEYVRRSLVDELLVVLNLRYQPDDVLEAIAAIKGERVGPKDQADNLGCEVHGVRACKSCRG